MSPGSPLAAMLWENWRLTRNEVLQRLAIGFIAGSGALLLLGVGQALWILILVYAFIYMSIAKLNGGKFLDGYKPGFPLYLFYTRPVSTSVYVGVAMAYDAITAAVMYTGTAAVLGYVFDQPLPLFPVALLIIVYHLAYMCVQWGTQSRAVQWIGSMVITLPPFFFLQSQAAAPTELHFTFAQAAILVIAGAVFCFLTMAGVARQRRGEPIAILRPARSHGYPDWLVSLFRFRCPTSSATRAQLWFELKSSGLPSLSIGLGLAALIFLLFAIAIPVEFLRHFAILSVMISGPTLLLLLGGNAFGIRRRQGRTYASAFEVTQPYGISRLVGLKLLVRTGCALLALVVVGASAWFSTALIGAWGSWIVEGGKDAVPELLKVRGQVGDALANMSVYSLALLAVIVSVAAATLIAFLAAFAAVRARYPRQLKIAGWTLLSMGLILVMLAIAVKNGVIPGGPVGILFAATGWAFVISLVLAIVYLSWKGFAERALTSDYASAAVLVSVVFGAAWMANLLVAGFPFAGASPAVIVGVGWPVLLPLLSGLLAPWSLGRLRHM
ncbi:MAG: hypothetical protein K0Q92_2245 [Steroidobacteraceae bacterium]|jgi:hypothetical protein|nr:hypothetical protein [Steroidobacteraceae bacterium]